MNKSDAFPGSYLKAGDFERPRTLTITACTQEDISRDDEPAKVKPVLYFREVSKGDPLGVQKWDQLTEIFHNENSDAWLDKQVEVFADHSVMYQGKSSPGIRYRAPQPVPQPNITEPVPEEEATF